MPGGRPLEPVGDNWSR